MSRQIRRWQPQYPELANQLRAARVAAGLSQHDMAFHLGMPQPAYWLIERGINRLPAGQLAVVATLLDLDADELALLAGYEWPGETEV
ncbi:MAG TPA: helix-turn-helix transcriptional regulator [Thermomicrobiales bacterium]|nr:helix-turn-helix transcriptional regulator [Thermomicrobiales bacterium]